MKLKLNKYLRDNGLEGNFGRRQDALHSAHSIVKKAENSRKLYLNLKPVKVKSKIDSKKLDIAILSVIKNRKSREKSGLLSKDAAGDVR